MSAYLDKYGKNRIAMTCYGILILAFIISIIILYVSYHRYNYKGNKLKLTNVNEFTVEMKDVNNNMLVMKAADTPIPLNSDYTIHYLDETLHYTSSFESGNQVFTFSDASQITQPLFYVGAGDTPINRNKDLSETQISEKNLIFKLDRYYKEYKSILIYIVCAVFGSFLLLLGIGLFFYPEVFWCLQTVFTVKDGEPTDWAIFSNMVAGVVVIISTYYGFFKILI